MYVFLVHATDDSVSSAHQLTYFFPTAIPSAVDSEEENEFYGTFPLQQ